MPIVDPSLAPADWPLSADGRAAARALRGRIPDGAGRISSPELKARQTLELAAPGAYAVDDRLGEVRRPVEPVDDDFRWVRRAWVADQLDERHRGWETQSAAAQRFAAAVRDAGDGPVVLATHGMVLTAWLVSIGAVAAGEPAAQFWEELRLPDLVELDR